jgi:putative hydrolase
MFSNTALAHQLKKTHDWVIIYFYDDQHQEGQHTLVTETRGPLLGRRVVRGRENECLRHTPS